MTMPTRGATGELSAVSKSDGYSRAERRSSRWPVLATGTLAMDSLMFGKR